MNASDTRAYSHPSSPTPRRCRRDETHGSDSGSLACSAPPTGPENRRPSLPFFMGECGLEPVRQGVGLMRTRPKTRRHEGNAKMNALWDASRFVLSRLHSGINRRRSAGKAGRGHIMATQTAKGAEARARGNHTAGQLKRGARRLGAGVGTVREAIRGWLSWTYSATTVAQPGMWGRTNFGSRQAVPVCCALALELGFDSEGTLGRSHGRRIYGETARKTTYSTRRRRTVHEGVVHVSYDTLAQIVNETQANKTNSDSSSTTRRLRPAKIFDVSRNIQGRETTSSSA